MDNRTAGQPSQVVEVRLTLASPVRLPEERLIFGDALLLIAWVKQEFPESWVSRRPSAWVRPDLPVVRDPDGFWRVSCLRFDNVLTTHRFRIAKNIDKQVVAPKVASAKTGALAFPPALDSACQSALIDRQMLVAESASFLAEVPVARTDEFLDLIGLLPGVSVGPGRHVGYGAVSEATVKVVPGEASAVFDTDGSPRRPVPIKSPADKPANSIVRAMRVEPPYWHGPVTLCACPLSQTLFKQFERRKPDGAA